MLEWASVPYQPISPKPNQVYSVGVVAGLLLIVGPLILTQLLNPIVSSENGLRGLVEVPVLVTVPRIVTRDNVGQNRRRFFKNLGISVLSAAALAAVMVVVG